MARVRGLPILIVDDYRTMLRIVRLLLRQLGYHDVDEASDGTAALELLRARRYGLVIADWSLQPMTGLELLHAVRADPALAKIPFVMLTGESLPARLDAAAAAGVDACLLKPFDAAALSREIAGLVPHQASV